MRDQGRVLALSVTPKFESCLPDLWMDPQEIFVENLALIGRVIGFICRRTQLRGADAEDFASSVKLRLIEDNYAVLRKFQGRSSLATYLIVVIQRLYLDYRISQHGKWRPSAEATRLGPHAIKLETLIGRDGKTLEEAEVLLGAEGLPAKEVRALFEQLPRRIGRPLQIDEPPRDSDALISAEEVEEPLMRNEREQLAARASRILQECLRQLDAEDQVILKMRFQDGFAIAEIARVLRFDPRRLYKQIERTLSGLRDALEKRGVPRQQVLDLIGAGSESLHIDFQPLAGNAPIDPSTNQGDTPDEGQRNEVAP